MNACWFFWEEHSFIASIVDCCCHPAGEQLLSQWCLCLLEVEQKHRHSIIKCRLGFKGHKQSQTVTVRLPECGKVVWDSTPQCRWHTHAQVKKEVESHTPKIREAETWLWCGLWAAAEGKSNLYSATVIPESSSHCLSEEQVWIKH